VPRKVLEDSSTVVTSPTIRMEGKGREKGVIGDMSDEE
jgi:hypothetical protein